MSQLFVDDVVSKEGTNSVGFSKGISVSVASTFSGDVSIGGTLTYEDVTNIDAVGLITARNGLKIGAAGIGGTIRANGDTTLAGVVTATSFVGDGSALTSLPAQATIANNSDNRVITGGSGVNLNGEANLKFDGSKLDIDSSAQNILQLNSTNSDGPNVPFQRSGTGFGNVGSAAAVTGGTATDFAIGATTNLIFGSNGSNERARIKTNGDVTIGTGVTISSAGICTITTGTDLNGYKIESGSYDNTALNGEFDFELENGHVQTHTGSTAGTYFPDFRVSSSQSLSSVMDVGDVISATLIVAASNTSHYCTTGIKIDNSTSNVTIEWIGSSAPSAGKGAGYDVYSFTIQKTAATPAYLVIVNATDAG